MSESTDPNSVGQSANLADAHAELQSREPTERTRRDRFLDALVDALLFDVILRGQKDAVTRPTAPRGMPHALLKYAVAAAA